MKWIVLIVASILLLGCSNLSEEQKQTLGQYAADMLSTGSWTQVQYDAFMAWVNGSDSGWWREPLTAVVSIVGALFGVKLWRGGVNSRVGTIPQPK